MLLLLLIFLLELSVTLQLLLNIGKAELAVNLGAREDIFALDELHALDFVPRSAYLELSHDTALMECLAKFLP